MWTKIWEKLGRIKPLVKEREELSTSFRSDSTQYVAPSLALVVTLPCRSVTQVGLHSKMPNRKSPRHGAHGLGGLG